MRVYGVKRLHLLAMILHVNSVSLPHFKKGSNNSNRYWTIGKVLRTMPGTC